MARLAQIRGPLIAGLLWIALAFASTTLRDKGGAMLLLWLPTGVHVASVYATPRKRWPWLLGTLFTMQVLYAMWRGVPFVPASGIAFANGVEALLCAYLGIRVLGGRAKSPQTFGHVAGLFGAALLGCAAGSLISLMFVPIPNIGAPFHWFLSSVLAVLTATPVLLYLRRWLGFGDQDVRSWRGGRRWDFVFAVAGMTALGALVFASPVRGATPILFVAIVFAVFRFGQLAAACGVIAYAAMGMVVSLGGHSPSLYLDADPFTAALILQGQMLLMLATALPLAAMLLTRDRLEQGLRWSNDELRANLTILNLTKTLAGIGRWQYDLETGAQNWSEKMLELNGLSPDLAPDPGDIRELLPDGGEELFAKLAEHCETRIPYSFEYSVTHPDGSEHILKMNVCNEFDPDGVRIALFAVAMDVTEQVRREQALKRAREQAIEQAAEAQKLAKTDPLTGLANRRATIGWLESMMTCSLEIDEPLAVLMFDIDHFKLINDTYGHQTGDEVLCKIAEIARAQIRAEDLVGRIGGEEFVCILSGIGGREARALAERVCRAIAQGTERASCPAATISIGLALLRKGDTVETLLRRADAALYEAKENGRNQVRRAA
uniref:sensor domain-containing diguanylate cyclase n=1 Tax=Altererythrobacter segetis TaxID=1104773 RepID=UPI00140BC92B|nr:diguanylate cyclase [Altererythrobacter segetis]